MTKQTTWTIVGAVLVVAVALGVVVATSTKSSDKGEETSTTTSAANDHSSHSMNDMASSTAVATTTVEIKDYMFTPMAITVKVGDTVTWTNKDAVKHNVMADTPSSDAPSGPLLAQGESYKFTFAKAGTYKVHCDPHPYMQQTITVTE